MIDNTLQEIASTIFELFLILVLVGVGVYFSDQTPLNDITKSYLERGCVYGGFKTTDIQAMKSDLGKEGFDPAFIDIKITPSTAIDITDTTYTKRGEIVNLKITYNKLGLLDSIFRRLGVTSDTKNSSSRYGMSERP